MSKGIRGTAPGPFTVSAAGTTVTVIPAANGDVEYAFPSAVADQLAPGDPIVCALVADPAVGFTRYLPADPVGVAGNVVTLGYTNAANLLSLRVSTDDGSPVDVTFGGAAAVTLTHGVDYTASAVTGSGTAVLTPTGAAGITKLENLSQGWDFDFTALPVTLDALDAHTNVTVGGSVADLPSALTALSVYGAGVITGSVSDLPSGLTTCQLGDGAQVSGAYNTLPSALLVLRLLGTNTVGGAISASPAGLTDLQILGNNTLSGDIVMFPNSLTTLRIEGSNTLGGDIADKPVNARHLTLAGNNTIDTVDAISWPATMEYVRLWGAAKSSAFVDAVLNSLAADVTTWVANPTAIVELKNSATNADRTAASDAAVTTIEGLGADVRANPDQ